MRWCPYALASILLAGGVALADVTIEERIQSGDEAASAQTVRLYASPTSMRIEEPEGSVIILRADKEVAWYLDMASKTYVEVPFKNLITDLSRQQEAYDQALKSMDETIQTLEGTAGVDKETIDQMKAERAKLEITVVDEGQEDVAGRSCAHTRILQAEEPAVEVWTATDLANAEALAKFNLYRFAREDWGMAWTKVRGVPLRVVVHSAEGGIERSTEAVKVEEKPIDAALFEPPAGYTKLFNEVPPEGDDE